MFPCKFNYSTRTLQELAARRAIQKIEGKDVKDIKPYVDDKSAKYKKMVEIICEELGATTLKYQTLKDMVEAIGLPKKSLCVYCWTGEEP
jgi:amidophosphoribosyltransferase